MRTKNRIVMRGLFGFGMVAASVFFSPVERGETMDLTSRTGGAFIVTNNQDSGPGSLRQAITDANAAAGADVINLNIPGGGFQTILLTSSLPTITDPVIIDGTTQPGYTNVPLVILSGQRLHITAGSSQVKAVSVIRAASGGGITLETGGGNLVTGCFLGISPANEADTTTGNLSGVEIINSPNNQIGANFTTSLRNVIAYNTGVRITGAGSTGNIVVGNIFGMRSNGTDTATGNGNYGVYVESASGNRIGGTTAAERNLLSGYNRTSNSSAGIELFMATNNHVQGNYIGTDITGTIAKGNRDGIRIIESSNNMIGAAAGTTFAGPCTGGCNLISGNVRDGVRLSGAGATGNRIDYNHIGLTGAGTAALRNSVFAIHFTNANQNIIGKPAAVQTGSASSHTEVPAEIITVEDENFCIAVDTGTSSHVITPKQGGPPITGPGEITVEPQGHVFYTSTGSGVRVVVTTATLPNTSGAGVFQVEGLPAVRIYDPSVRTSECTIPSEGNQTIAGESVDDTFPGSIGNKFIGNSFGQSVTGLNLALPSEVALRFNFGSNVLLGEDRIFTRTLSCITVQDGIAVNADGLYVDFQSPTVFTKRTDPTPFDLTTPTANNGMQAPTVFVSRDVGGSFRLSGTVVGPPNATVRLTFSVQENYRPPDGFERVTLTPNAVPNATAILDGQGNGTFKTVLPSTYLLSDLIVGQATVEALLPGSGAVPQGGAVGDTSEFSRPVKVPRGSYDFDGDGRTDFSVVRPGAGNTESVWYIFNSANNTVRVQQFGLGDDKIIPGDYQGDYKADFAVWRPSNSTLYYSRINGDPATNFNGIPWGISGDIPVAGDFDDDGVRDAAVYRPSQGIWYIRSSVNGSLRAQRWGLPTDKLVPADYDGDGETDIAVYRNGVWYISVCPVCPSTILTFGVATDIPVPGDYDGDGIDDIAVWRPSDGVWWILQSRSGSVTAVKWGIADDKPLKGDWDGDGRNDIAVWRPSSGDWWILKSADNSLSFFHWGQNGDIPVPAH